MSILRTTSLGLAAAAALTLSSAAHAGPVENMERERAILLETALDPNITPQERTQKITVAQRRLVDLERIVLRDKSLVGRDTPAVRRAFANYDKTFLVHASAEKNRHVLAHWLDQLGLTSQAVLQAERRRR